MAIFAILGVIAFVALIFGPQFWIKRTMRRHGMERPGMPGTGGELARHLLDDAGLQNVKVEIEADGRDHYSTEEKAVRLSEANFKGRSITAVAVAAHEVAHALQDRDHYPPLVMRHRLVQKTMVIERIGSLVLMATPVVFALTRSPAVLAVEIAAAIGILASTILIHLVTLPTEFDASFNKALPVLKNYLPADEVAGATSVLRAAAFTYVAGALVSLLNIGRWLRILRF
jgi:uncharacterized protein